MGKLREQVAKAEWESAVDIRWEDVSPSVAERAKERADVAIAVVRAYDAAQPGPRAVPGWVNEIRIYLDEINGGEAWWIAALSSGYDQPDERRMVGDGYTYEQAIAAALAQDGGGE